MAPWYTLAEHPSHQKTLATHAILAWLRHDVWVLQFRACHLIGKPCNDVCCEPWHHIQPICSAIATSCVYLCVHVLARQQSCWPGNFCNIDIRADAGDPIELQSLVLLVLAN